MENSDLAMKAGELLGELAELGHSDQCETYNFTNSAPCDCGLAGIVVKATVVVEGLMQLIHHRENTY